jgi:hypothetical protein
MLKRFSSLILALMLGGSVLAGAARLQDEHVCKMARMETMSGMEMTSGMETLPGMEMTRGMETMSCCKKHTTQSLVSDPGSGEECCVNIPQEPGSSGTTFTLRAPSFSIAVIHPAIVQSPITLPKPYERPYSTQIFLPNLQATYIRNLSFLI